MHGTKRKNMRKIFSFIAILGIYGVFANAHTPLFATNNAGRSAYFAAADEPDSLDIKKSKIVEELKARKDSTEKDVVKSFIDTSIAEVNNATDSANLDSISQLILAKVDACHEVESKEKATPTLNDAELDLLNKYYTDIINAANQDSVKSLVNDALGVIELREHKNKLIALLDSAVGDVNKEMVTPSDSEKIAKYTDDINKATNKSDADKAYQDAMAIVAVMRARQSAIDKIKSEMKDKKLTAEDEKALEGIIQDIAKSDDLGKIAGSMVSALVLVADDTDKKAVIETVLNYITTNPHFKKSVDLVKKMFSKEPETIAKIDEMLDGLVDMLYIALLSFQNGQSNSVGTLGNQQNGPAIEVTDQNNRVITLYNPKKVEFKKEK